MKALGGLIYQKRLKELNPCSFAKWRLPGAFGGGFADRGNGADTQGGRERGVWCRGHNEGMGRDFEKEKHEALSRSFLDNGAAE